MIKSLKKLLDRQVVTAVFYILKFKGQNVNFIKQIDHTHGSV